MTNFCTNCGHQNQLDNKICVECGKTLTVQETKVQRTEKASQPKKDRKLLSLKTKIIAIAGVLVLASLIGVYSWGTKTASADTVVSKFFEALQEEDAETLAKQVVLSNGETMTIKEAEAFIKQYGDITPYELEDIARVEKNGKVIGLFDAHKIIFPAQQVSFGFPHEGLTLTLNGEIVADAKNDEGEYIFSNLSPGLHDAEFIYEGDFTEFNYPFELAVEFQGDSSRITPIYEELPISSVSFELETYNTEDPDANKIIIEDKEIPVGEDRQTEEVGPLLLDGSTTAQAEVDFPWGKQLSEPIEITSGYHTIGFAGLEEKQQTALIDQLAAFAEEYIEAFGTRDSSAFSTLTKNQLEIFTEDINNMKEIDSYFKGSLTEVGVDEESIQISPDGQSVSLSAELVIEGANYYQSQTPEIDSIVQDVSMSFIYDKTDSKWLVDTYNEDMWFFDVTPTLTIEGSKKVFETKGSSEEAKEESVDETVSEEAEDEYLGLRKEDIEWFFSDYNDASVAAINSGDIMVVQPMIYNAGPRYEEQSDFIDYMYSKGITEDHLSTSVEKVKVLDDQYLEVTTIEKFTIHGTESSDEKSYRTVTKMRVNDGDWYVYELISTTEI